jgi:hypothetical protein
MKKLQILKAILDFFFFSPLWHWHSTFHSFYLFNSAIDSVLMVKKMPNDLLSKLIILSMFSLDYYFYLVSTY